MVLVALTFVVLVLGVGAGVDEGIEGVKVQTGPRGKLEGAIFLWPCFRPFNTQS